MTSIVEQELLRKKLYENLLEWLKDEIKIMNVEEYSTLLLLYIFNKNITKTEIDDPIFITSPSVIAKQQISSELKYRKLDHLTERIIEGIETRLATCASQMSSLSSTLKDDTCEMKGGYLIYKEKKYVDIANLGGKNPQHINYAIALQIRYDYIHLKMWGLSRDYASLGYDKKDGIEVFGSAFLHYFDEFCSPFPDLELPFGSRGSFFNTRNWNMRTLFVNPPFDNTLIAETYKYLFRTTEGKDHKLICILPSREDYPIVQEIMKHKWVREFTLFKSGTMPFYLDIMAEIKTPHYPICDVYEIIMETRIVEQEVEQL